MMRKLKIYSLFLLLPALLMSCVSYKKLEKVSCDKGKILFKEKRTTVFPFGTGVEKYFVYRHWKIKQVVYHNKQNRTVAYGLEKFNKSKVIVQVVDESAPPPGGKQKQGYKDIYILPSEMEEEIFLKICKCLKENISVARRQVRGLRSLIYSNHNPFEKDFFGSSKNHVISVERMNDGGAGYGKYDYAVSEYSFNERGGASASTAGKIKDGAYIFRRKPLEVQKEFRKKLFEYKDEQGVLFSDQYDVPEL